MGGVLIISSSGIVIHIVIGICIKRHQIILHRLMDLFGIFRGIISFIAFVLIFGKSGIAKCFGNLLIIFDQL